VATSSVVRTDLVTTVLTEGTLGYAPSAPVVNRVVGTYTALPAPGTIIHPGEALYRVDDAPVVLMAGATPAWRAFVPGMSDGPDVTELQTGLVALGDATGLFSAPNGHYDARTINAVMRWQAASGLPVTGQVTMGEVAFLPTPALVGAVNVALGQPAAPGDLPFQVTTTARVVTVPLGPDIPSVQVGEAVSIVLPTNATTPGRITTVGPAPPQSSGSPASQGGGGSSGGAGQQQAAALVTVVPDQPSSTGTASGVAVQVSLTTQSAANVLAVPISALLALAGGGYGLEVAGPRARRHLVGVTTGIFTGSDVQITSPGLRVGTRVVVAQ
jgi:peptidoglycan hydrolase-like protein with peptidoglycan-binding domain